MASEVNKELIALVKYLSVQHVAGHNGLYWCASGFVISEEYPFLGGSPDGVVHDASVPKVSFFFSAF